MIFKIILQKYDSAVFNKLNDAHIFHWLLPIYIFGTKWFWNVTQIAESYSNCNVGLNIINLIYCYIKNGEKTEWSTNLKTWHILPLPVHKKLPQYKISSSAGVGNSLFRVRKKFSMTKKTKHSYIDFLFNSG